MAGQLPTQVEDFISKYVDSVEEMEVLFLLSNAKERSWASKAVYEQIKSSQASVNQRLEGLVRKGLLAIDTRGETLYRYEPATPELAASVEALAAAYAERRVRVLEFLFSKPLSSLRTLSDAFRIRKDQTDG